MNELSAIPQEPLPYPGMDFTSLRQEGLEYIGRLAGDVWTDHNTHDPGITILEQVCYAITDLSYRLGFDIRDILAYPPSPTDGKSKPFLTAREVLPSDPLTINDHRKLIIDIDGVKNAWVDPIFPHLESGEAPWPYGFYNVLIDPEDDFIAGEAEIIDKVRTRLAGNRNLCEDFLEIKVLPVEEIGVRANITVRDECNAEELMAEIYRRLAEFISPSVPFYSRREMEAMGRTAAGVFEGPPLEHGFIDDAQLAETGYKTQIYTSDLAHVIRDIDGVKSVADLDIIGKSRQWCQWALTLKPGHAPRLKSITGLKLYKGNSACRVNRNKVKDRIDSLIRPPVKPLPDVEKDIPVVSGTYRELSDYETIQNDFPLNYGVGHFGLPEEATTQRKAQANQLRAYLILFDQILAGHFTQLEHVRDLFSPYYQETTTYFTQLPAGEIEATSMVKEAGGKEPEATTVKLLKTEDETDGDILERFDTAPSRRKRLEAELQAIVESPATALERKNRILNHLLARYSEEFTDSSRLYQQEQMTAEYITAKQTFLMDYPRVSRGRGQAFDYTNKKDTWDTENVSGLKRRICRQVGIADYRRKSLSRGNEEGFHLLEHILLHYEDNVTVIPAAYPDPFSFQISFVLPDWPGRFGDENFKELLEEIIIAETPAHITANFHWMDRKQMRVFEECYQRWLGSKAGASADVTEAAAKLIELLNINGALL